jgi:hypothetical protein
LVAAGILLSACGNKGNIGGDAVESASAVCSLGGGGGGEPTRVEPDDDMTPLRVLRRASIALVGAPPTDAEMQKVIMAGTEEQQFAAVDAFVDASLEDTRFYQMMFETARTWMNVPLVNHDADEPEYGPKQQRVLTACPMGSGKEGKIHYYRDDAATACDAASPETTIEPWWAPATQVTLVGYAASTAAMGKGSSNGNPIDIDCTGYPEGTCGCGPNGVNCYFDAGTYPGWAEYLPGNPDGQRRLLNEEQARLFAHIVWHDKPATDFILADYSVGPTEVQAAYVREAIAGGDKSMITNDAWWRPSKYSKALTDPLHTAGDPKAWREYTVSQVNTFFLADRNYKYDPRKETQPSKGFPSAGALTTIGFLAAYPRERLRAARALENFACEQLLPPGGDVKFKPYKTDPGREGPCENCHARIDPAAIHFKRFGKAGQSFEGWGATYFMPGVGDVWKWDPVWRTGEYPYRGEPFAQWNKWYRPGSRMTPATEAEVNANPYALFLDFLPPEDTLLGQTSDGTVGPLGFAKMIVAAGAFDKCVVRKVHERVMGRDIDPTEEAGYLDTLTQEFVTGGRLVRPFVKSLTQSIYFRKGG